MTHRAALWFLPLALLALGDCTQFPALDRTISLQADAAAYPALVPLEPLLAQASAGSVDAERTEASMSARVANLRARAARLRGSVLTGRERQRLEEGLQ